MSSELASSEPITPATGEEDRLQYLLGFKRLVTSISTTFINLPVDAIDAGLNEALRQIGLVSGAERSFVFQISAETKSISMTHEWFGDHITSALEFYHEKPLELFAPLLDTFTDNHAQFYASPLELPPDAIELTRILRSRKVKSLVVVPLGQADRKLGLLGFASYCDEKNWSEETVSLLELVGQMVTNVLARKHAEEALRESERRYRSLVDTSGDLIWAVDSEGRFTFLNPAAERFYGYKPEEMLGRPFTDFQSPEQKAKDLVALNETLATGHNVYNYESEQIRKDGTRIVVHANAVPILDSDGKVIGVTGTSTDVTERKFGETALREIVEGTARATAEDFFRSLVRHLASVLGTKYAFIAKLDAPGSQIAETLAVYRDGEYIPNSTYNIANTPSAEIIGKEFREFPNSMQELFPDDLYLRQEGIVSYMGAPLYDSLGRSLGILSVMDSKPLKDWAPGRWILSIFAARAGAELERLLVEREREVLQRQLLQAQKMEAIGQLAAGVAHDLNNALGAVVGHLQLMQRGDLSHVELENSVEVSLNGCKRASSLIEQLLGFSRQGRYNLQRLSLPHIVGETIDFLRKVIGKEIRIEHKLPVDSYFIDADQAQVQQVITNLIINAKQAMPEGGLISCTYEVRSIQNSGGFNPQAQPGTYAVLTLCDTGDGIPQENLEKIFEPFFTTKQEGKGTGLGLSMVYGIMQSHGGWIEVKSEVGQGSSFTLFFPLAARAELAEPTPLPTTVRQGSGIVLVIDDELFLVELAQKFLELQGVQSQGFCSAPDALHWYAQHHGHVDLVVLDMKMPRMDGSECFSALRAINPDARIVILSGYIQDESAQHLLEQGALKFFQKPLKYPELTEWIVEHL